MTNIGHSPVKFDYELLAPTRYNPDQANRKQPGSIDPYQVRLPKQPEMEVLSQICGSRAHQSLIKHPVIKSWVWLKWNRVRRYYHKELRVELLLMWFMTWYVFQTFGGLEWTHKCEDHMQRMNRKNSKKPSWDWNNVTSTNFCEFHAKLDDNKHRNRKFGHFETMSILEWMQYH